MPFKKLIISIFALALIIPSNTLCRKLKPDDNRPNILIVTIDTLRADRVRCYGYEKINTPIMDQLSREGVLFEDVSCAVPLTLPSHTSIFTGLYPFSHKMRHNLSYIKGWDKLTLAEILRQQGYKTAAFIGSSILDSKFGLEHGFNIYDDNFSDTKDQQWKAYAEKRASTVAKSALDWLQQNKEGKFFLWIHFFDPHEPYIPPEPFKSQYPEKPYDGEVAYADSVLGKVFAKLKEWQLYRNTLIIVTSDHGEGLGEHKERDHGFFIYESTLRVPLIFFWEGNIPRGKRVKVPVRLIDIMPTVLDLLDVPLTTTIDGKSFSSLILGKEGKQYNPRGEPSYAESYYARIILNWSELRGLREGNWKYIDAPKPELYNLTSDPKELRNLYQAKKKIALSLKAELERIASGEKAALAKAEQTPDPKLLAKLESLGYLGTVHPKASESEAGNRPDPKDKIDFWNKIYNSFNLMQMKQTAKAIKGFKQLLSEEPENFMVIENLGKCYYQSREYDKALQLFQQASKIRKKLFGKENPDNAKNYNYIGAIYKIKGQYDKALEFHQRALEVITNYYEEEHSDTAISFKNIGDVYRNMGKYDKALEFYQKALEIMKTLFGDNHPDTASCYNDIGVVYENNNEDTKALMFYEKALKIKQKVYGEEHPDTATSYNNIGGVYYSRGEDEKAMEYYQKALNIRLKVFKEDHPDTSTSYNNIGAVYYSRGEYDKALEFYQKALEIKLKIFGENHPNTASSYNNIGWVYYYKDNYLEALQYLRKSLEIWKKFLGPEHPNTQKVLKSIKFIESKVPK
jgi:arylsulfatase A-like enzyme/Tfp pilus assembly protein PilF